MTKREFTRNARKVKAMIWATSPDQREAVFDIVYAGQKYTAWIQGAKFGQWQIIDRRNSAVVEYYKTRDARHHRLGEILADRLESEITAATSGHRVANIYLVGVNIVRQAVYEAQRAQQRKEAKDTIIQKSGVSQSWADEHLIIASV